MTEPDRTNPSSLIGLLGDDSTGELEARYDDVCRHLGNAIIHAQLFEAAVQIAAPALAADGTDDDAARQALDDGLNRRLNDAVNELRHTHPDLIERLRHAKNVRNSVVHDGLIRTLVAVMTGEHEQLINELDEAAQLLGAEAQHVMETIWPHVADIVGLTDIDQTTAITNLMTQLLQAPDALDGVERIQDFQLTMDRLLNRLDNPT